MTASVSFEVDGKPEPQGSKFAIIVKGRAQVIDDNPHALKAWRKAVAGAAREAVGGRPPLDVACSLEAVFYMPRPKTVTRPEPTVKPDLDKLLRALMDALKTGGVYTDDARVTRISIEEVYGQHPGVSVTVMPRRSGLHKVSAGIVPAADEGGAQ